jgi:hypothetical protein
LSLELPHIIYLSTGRSDPFVAEFSKRKYEKVRKPTK